MAGTNDFKAVATGGGANVITQSAYAALTTFLANGYSSGVVASNQFNKIIRQSSFVSAAIGKIIADANLNALDDGDLSTFSANLLTALTGRLVGVQVFATPGASTYTPTSGTKYVIVDVVGGGAAGGSCAAATSAQVSAGGGGGAGAYAKVKITSAFSGVTVTVGAGGTPGAAGNNPGGNGGTSSFGALISCPGGYGTGNGSPAITATATSNSCSGGPGGGVPSITGTTLFSSKGDTGKGGFAIPSSVVSVQTGSGGHSNFGVPGYAFNGSFPGVDASGHGAGGSGAASLNDNVARQGGAGAPGLVIVWEYA